MTYTKAKKLIVLIVSIAMMFAFAIAKISHSWWIILAFPLGGLITYYFDK